MAKKKTRVAPLPERLPDQNKKNPNTLCRVLGIIRTHSDPTRKLSQSEFARRLDASWQANGPRYGLEEIKRDTFFRATENGKVPNTVRMGYRHLEVYAQYLDVPTALILLVSRLVSEKSNTETDAKPDRSSEIVSKLRTVLDHWDAHHAQSKRPLTNEEVWSIIQSYSVSEEAD